MRVEIPRKLEFLFKPARYKVAYGGRGSAKSWTFAQALLILGSKQKLRILCAREVQKSIKDSVHKLLSDQIKRLGLESFYQILNTEIRGKNGTEILFSGLSDQTADSIKSFEGVSICWVEEAQTVTKRSWDILRPTIRKAGSEIWVTYNPELETDATHVMFVVKPPSDAVVVKMNWQDNPWFSPELEKERLDCLEEPAERLPEHLGRKTKPAVAGAIYYDEMTAMEKEGRIRSVPRNPTWKLKFIRLELSADQRLTSSEHPMPQKQLPLTRFYMEWLQPMHYLKISGIIKAKYLMSMQTYVLVS